VAPFFSGHGVDYSAKVRIRNINSLFLPSYFLFTFIKIYMGNIFGYLAFLKQCHFAITLILFLFHECCIHRSVQLVECYLPLRLQLAICVNYAKINNYMLRMRGHVSTSFFLCDVSFLQTQWISSYCCKCIK